MKSQFDMFRVSDSRPVGRKYTDLLPLPDSTLKSEIKCDLSVRKNGIFRNNKEIFFNYKN